MDKLTSLGAGHPPTPAHQQLVATINTSRSASPSTTLTRTGGPGTNAGAAVSTLALSSSTAGSASPGRSANTLTLSSSGGGPVAGKADGSNLKRLFVEYYNKHQETLAREAKEAVQRDYGALPDRLVCVYICRHSRINVLPLMMLDYCSTIHTGGLQPGSAHDCDGISISAGMPCTPIMTAVP